jgi:hypothetical protein
MPHLIKSFEEKAIKDGLADLRAAHDFLVDRAKSSLKEFEAINPPWGINAKRISVNLQCEKRPILIGKDEEKLSEVINMAATAERLIDVLEWFGRKEEFSIHECHPSTSDNEGGNDLVLKIDKKTAVRCEVCDVISDNAGSNGKEKKDLQNLGCGVNVPDDGVERYICTSNEFASALTGENRKWQSKQYRYGPPTICGVDTVLLLLVQPNKK